MNPQQRRSPAPYLVARIFTVVLTATIWCGVLAGLGFALSGIITRGVMPPGAIKYMMAGAYLFVPLFSAQGALVGFLESFARGFFLLNPSGGEVDPADARPRSTAARARNPWTLGLSWALLLGAPVSGLALVAVPNLWPNGLARGEFVGWFVCGGALLAAATSFFVCGQPFLEETHVPRPDRRWTGSRSRYVWTRHALPNGLVNAVINGFIAFAIFPQPALDPRNAVPFDVIVGDTLIALLILSAAVMNGAHTHVRSDVYWGVIAAEPDSKVPGVLGRILRLFGLSVLIASVVFAVLRITGTESMSLPAFVTYRFVSFGAYPTFVAYMAAHWALRSIRGAP